MNQQPSIRVFAPAKINWALTIERKREDGFHDIHTVFQALAWGDELVCEPLAEPVCRIEVDDPAVPTGPENLIARAWARLHEAWPDRVGGLAVRLIKRIPMGAGLGGGSADAAAALVAVDRLYGLGLGRAELERQAGALGSDCAFFLRGGTSLASGRGERLEPLTSRLPDLWLVVLYPGFHSATAQAYGRVRPEHWEGDAAARAVARAVAAGDVAALRAGARNVFHEIALAGDERYRAMRDRMKAAGLSQPMLSGSGSAMFAFARDGAQARQACERLNKEAQYPLAIVTRPRRCGVKLLINSHRATGPGDPTADHRPPGRFLQRRGREHV